MYVQASYIYFFVQLFVINKSQFRIDALSSDNLSISTNVHGRPKLLKLGFLCRNINGTWILLCKITPDFCSRLGLKGNRGINEQDYNRTVHLVPEKENCRNGRWTNCAYTFRSQPNSQLTPNRPLITTHVVLANSTTNNEVDPESANNWPWTATIYFNGNYACLGVLLNKQWVLADKRCFR